MKRVYRSLLGWVLLAAFGCFAAALQAQETPEGRHQKGVLGGVPESLTDGPYGGPTDAVAGKVAASVTGGVDGHPELESHAGDGKVAVVELYTSQGCSSCPPADELVRTLESERNDLLFLSYAVDYWDFLGWPDTLARSENARRQRAYARRRGDQAIYTPQIVVNGGPHLVGHDRHHLERIVGDRRSRDKALASPAPFKVHVDLSATAKTFDVGLYPAGSQPRPFDLGRTDGAEMMAIWALLISSDVEVRVGAGENGGRRMHYTNVVRDMLPVGIFDGKPQRLTLPLQDLIGAHTEIDRFAVLVQQETDGVPGPILGGALIDVPALAAWR